ncbi:hypothetical protein K2Q16_01515 [Patescibacteria group bacterium]|nr:hypothetical protein [Patescibacteria group bacterium]
MEGDPTRALATSREKIISEEDVPESAALTPEVISGIKDMLFDEYMKQQLIEDFFEELLEYVEDDEVDAMKGALAEYSDAEVYAAISLPKELRERQFTGFHEKIVGGRDPRALMSEFVALSAKHGFGVGYHTSAADIKQDESSGRWEIIGREPDHRDGDLARAYYSSHYRHLYSPKDHQLYVKKQHPRFIYIVRTEPTHKTDGNWSRASRLSIIAKVPYADVVGYVETTTKKVEGRR